MGSSESKTLKPDPVDPLPRRDSDAHGDRAAGLSDDPLREGDSTETPAESTTQHPHQRAEADEPERGSSIHSIGSSVVPVSSFAQPDEQTVISSGPPVPAPSHRDAGSPSELGRLLEGERLDHFDLEEFIGGGGMGAVFRGIDTMLGRTVAIKVLSRQNGGDEESSRRFKNEAQSAARLDHENIARVYFVGQDRGWHYIVFEFIEGENLRDMVQRSGPLPVGDVVHYVLQIAEALAHAAGRDVVHRDIKPSNVLVARGRRAKLVDMGLARLHQVETSQGDITASGVTLGTFDYISPEQARDPRSADVRSDLYSLGCTMYYMLTGRPPFPEGTVLQKLLQHQGDEAPDPREFRRDLPAALCEVLRRLLAKNPQARYQHPDELIEDLLLISDQLGLAHHRPSRVRSEPARVSSAWYLRHLPWIVPAALLLVSVLLIELLGALGEDPPPPSPEPLVVVRDNGTLPEGVNQPLAGPPVEEDPAAETADPAADPPESADGNGGLEEDRPAAGDANGPTVENGNSSADEPAAAPRGSNGSDLEIPADQAAPSASADEPPPAARGPILLAPGTPEEQSFDTISAALASASTGAVIELRFDGPRVERPWRVTKKKLTVRAAEGFQPIVRFVPTGTDPVLQPRSMVTVSSGELNLVNVRMHLEIPRHLSADHWAMFQLMQADRLRLDRTELTIDNASPDGGAYHRQVCTIRVDAPPGTELLLADSPQARSLRVNVELRNCVVRGEADLLGGNFLSSVDLSWENGLLATSERLVSLSPDDLKGPAVGELRVDLKHLTAEMRQGLASVAAQGDALELFLMRFDISESILRVGDAPLITHLGTGSTRRLRNLLQWNADRNFYESVGIFWKIDDQRADDFAEMAWTEWQAFWGPTHEAARRPQAVVWLGLPPRTKPFSQRTPEDYALDLSDPDNPALAASTDGTTNAGLKPELLPSFAAVQPPGEDQPASSDLDAPAEASSGREAAPDSADERRPVPAADSRSLAAEALSSTASHDESD